MRVAREHGPPFPNVTVDRCCGYIRPAPRRNGCREKADRCQVAAPAPRAAELKRMLSIMNKTPNAAGFSRHACRWLSRPEEHGQPTALSPKSSPGRDSRALRAADACPRPHVGCHQVTAAYYRHAQCPPPPENDGKWGEPVHNRQQSAAVAAGGLPADGTQVGCLSACWRILPIEDENQAAP